MCLQGPALYREALWGRVKLEVRIALSYWKSIIPCTVILIYLVLIVFRNAAYYRSRFSDREDDLYDVGMLLIPELKDEYRIIPEVLTTVQIGFLFAVHFCSLLIKPERRDLSTIDMAMHYVYTLTILQTLRATTFLVTTLPDPQPVCHMNSSKYHPPTLSQVFYKYNEFVCGDLVFSGHTLSTMTVVMIVFWYSARVMPQAAAVVSKIVVVLLECIILPMVVAARNHYSVDILVSLYITPLMFYWISKRMKPSKLLREPIRDPRKLSMQVQTESFVADSVISDSVIESGVLAYPEVESDTAPLIEGKTKEEV